MLAQVGQQACCTPSAKTYSYTIHIKSIMSVHVPSLEVPRATERDASFKNVRVIEFYKGLLLNILPVFDCIVRPAAHQSSNLSPLVPVQSVALHEDRILLQVHQTFLLHSRTLAAHPSPRNRR
jgi:hypothetical protein